MAASAYIGLVLCVDDYGMAPGIGKAVRRLVGAGRISATSCMTTMSAWKEEGVLLREFDDKIEVGLHLTLTDHLALGPMPRLAPDGRLPAMSSLLRRAVFGALDKMEILDELHRQLDAFTAVFGRPPDFVDGHQHVHQFPQIRDAVIELIHQWPAGRAPWLRICWEPPGRLLRRRVSLGRAMSIGFFGLALRRLAEVDGVRINKGFTGIYEFDRETFDGDLCKRLITATVDGSVMLCHAGEVDETLRRTDSLTTPREQELAYLMSDDFPRLLEKSGVRLRRASDLF